MKSVYISPSDGLFSRELEFLHHPHRTGRAQEAVVVCSGVAVERERVGSGYTQVGWPRLICQNSQVTPPHTHTPHLAHTHTHGCNSLMVCRVNEVCVCMWGAERDGEKAGRASVREGRNQQHKREKVLRVHIWAFRGSMVLD